MKLVINNLAFERNYHYLFQSIHCTLKTGHALQICGANGSGKSTLLRILAGFIEIQEGSVLWNDQCIFQSRENYQSNLHYVGHQNGVKPYLTVSENLKLNCALANIKISSQHIRNALDALNIGHLKDVQTLNLSAGQLRRVALARLLLNEVPLWILDEPTTALDVVGQEIFAGLIKKHLGKGGMVIFTAHHEIKLEMLGTIMLGRDHHPSPLPQTREDG